MGMTASASGCTRARVRPAGHGAREPVQDRRDLADERGDPAIEPSERGDEARLGRIGDARFPAERPGGIASKPSGMPAVRVATLAREDSTYPISCCWKR